LQICLLTGEFLEAKTQLFHAMRAVCRINNVETVSALLSLATNQQLFNEFERVVSLLSRKLKFGFAGGILGDLWGWHLLRR
jgi:hypothetical protein